MRSNAFGCFVTTSSLLYIHLATNPREGHVFSWPVWTIEQHGLKVAEVLNSFIFQLCILEDLNLTVTQICKNLLPLQSLWIQSFVAELSYKDMYFTPFLFWMKLVVAKWNRNSLTSLPKVVATSMRLYQQNCFGTAFKRWQFWWVNRKLDRTVSEPILRLHLLYNLTG